jgi:S-DNA-T family DNA segregation ATPase FtsK/SpoIIIE
MAKKKLHQLFNLFPEAKGLFTICASFLIFLCLFSFYDGDPGKNWLGLIGYSLAFSWIYLFGLGSYLWTFFGFWIGVRYLLNKPFEHFSFKLVNFAIFTFSFCLMASVFAEHHFFDHEWIRTHVYSESILLKTAFEQRLIRYNFGGVPCYFLYRDLPLMNLRYLLSDLGIVLTFGSISLLTFLMFFDIQVKTLFKQMMPAFKKGFKATSLSLRLSLNKLKETSALIQAPPAKKDSALAPAQKTLDRPRELKIKPFQPLIPQMKEPGTKELSKLELDQVKIFTDDRPKPKLIEDFKKSKMKIQNKTNFELPPLTLLSNAKKIDQPTLTKDLKAQAAILEETLLSFGIEGKVGEINCGPTITSFEVHPAVGVKVQKIKSLENDIALNLQAKSIRIIAPIPGKAVVGVEVPSLYPQEVGFKEMLYQYQQGSIHHKIPVMLGKTVSGDDVTCDLTKMPHCIIAGATGSGKSVCINTLIMSILMTSKPDEVKLILIDPKKVELTPFSELPHMIAPVITEAHGAYAALNWLVKEMQSRYDLLKQLGLRNVTAFNSRKPDVDLENALGLDVPEKMHSIVAIIDEFADLMMTSQQDLETPIARIAQMARAVGIHLILATQRPSREVITGLIKANFPTRIAFKVASRINSQIILDDNGAESLLGNGDMLFMPPGSSQLVRAQGVYIRDEDINRVIEFILSQRRAEYLIKSFDRMEIDESQAMNLEEFKDDLYPKAYEIVVESQNASTTFLQRKLKVGYARAASLIDELEERGIIGVQEGSKPRRVLVQSPFIENFDKSGNDLGSLD